MLEDSSPFRLKAHPTARSQAVTSFSLPAGATIMSTQPLATVLIESEKGKRCDLCCRVRKELQRCSGCKHYWYCDSTCQMRAWKAHHRRLCKSFPGFLTSHSYQRLSSPERAHSLLLAHLLAEYAKALGLAFSKQPPPSDDLSDPLNVLLSLLPRTNGEHKPELPRLDATVPDSLIAFLSCRFSNNNFTIHSSRMDVFAHGIFPLASRSFNHSCIPSAVPVFTLSQETLVRMDTRLIRDLKSGEEITIPYVDPALPYSSRQRDLSLTYGFTCACPLCQHPGLITPSSSVLPSDLTHFEAHLCESVLPSLLHDNVRVESMKLLEEFLPAFHPAYLPSLAEAFSRASHDGPYDIAVQKGATLLALYCLVYPTNYPIVGLHALELAKTCWNAVVTDTVSRSALAEVVNYLTFAERIFSVLFGHIAETPDDDAEPTSELRLLKEMVKTELECGKIN